jgi:putative ABC transport system permease protein
VITLAFRSLSAHKRRLVSTLLAVAIGVAFLAGTLVLADTTRSSFDDLFQQMNAGTDVVVRPKPPTDEGEHDMEGDGDSVVLLDQAVADEVARVAGVRQVVPGITGFGTLVGRDGKPLGGMGPPTVAGSWDGEGPMNPFRIVEGAAPVRDTDVVIDKASAIAGQLRTGDTTTVQTPEPVAVTITGIAGFGDRDSAGGLTFVGFTLDGAQRHVLHQPGKITSIAVAGDGRLSQTELARRIEPVLPAGTETITGDQLSIKQRAAIDGDFLDFFNTFLLAFAGIALLVATFSIYNTFSILMAQRTRESALLRALGASRRQILTTAVLETFAIGVVASAIGLVSGIGLAVGLRSIFALLGFSLPEAALVIQSRTVVLTLVVGTVVTVLAGLLPARRSSRIPPLAALRDIAVDRTDQSTLRLVTGVLLTLAGGVFVFHTAMTGGDNVLARAAAGALVGLVGVVILGPTLASTVIPVIGWPLAALRGTTGRLARENAGRNPRRTSGTAAALMIGVAVVTSFTVMAQSLKVSAAETVMKSFGGDLVISPGTGAGGSVPPALARQLSDTPEVDLAFGFTGGRVKLGDRSTGVTVAEPTALGAMLDLGVQHGSITALRPDQLAVSTAEAEARGWQPGTPVPARFRDGQTATFTVGAIYDLTDLLSDIVLPRAAWTPHVVQDRDEVVLVRLAEGVSIAEGRAAVEPFTKPLAGVEVQDREQFLDSFGAQINQQLVLIYVMLVLAIIIALLGIANTLALSIHERVRELGLLRAVGQTRRQVRSMVRGESVIIALFGTLTGVALGIYLGWALVKAAASEGIGTFSAAPLQLIVVAVVGGLAGVLAARRPAKRAARLDVLAAIATD